MQSVSLPDPLFIEGQRAAEASGVSIESFVREAVELHLEDAPVETRSLSLSPDQVAGLRKAQASIAAGKGVTMEQVEKNLAARKAV